MKTLRMIGVCRTPMWYTRHVFRNRQFMHSESHWIAIKVDVISWCDITWMETCVCKHEKDVKSHWNSVFAGTSNLSWTVYLVISITKRYYRKGLSKSWPSQTTGLGHFVPQIWKLAAALHSESRHFITHLIDAVCYSHHYAISEYFAIFTQSLLCLQFGLVMYVKPIALSGNLQNP